MNRLIDFFMSIVAGFCLGIFLSFIPMYLLGAAEIQWAWQADTVDRGLAIYCPDDGQWAWIGECDHD